MFRAEGLQSVLACPQHKPEPSNAKTHIDLIFCSFPGLYFLSNGRKACIPIPRVLLRLQMRVIRRLAVMFQQHTIASLLRNVAAVADTQSTPQIPEKSKITRLERIVSRSGAVGKPPVCVCITNRDEGK
jgi:hypothetical protein